MSFHYSKSGFPSAYQTGNDENCYLWYKNASTKDREAGLFMDGNNYTVETNGLAVF
jgi:hypothetical protein